jgi:hypothetical protein
VFIRVSVIHFLVGAGNTVAILAVYLLLPLVFFLFHPYTLYLVESDVFTVAKVSFVIKQNKCGVSFSRTHPPEATSSQNSGLLYILFHRVQQTTAVLHRHKYSSYAVFHGDDAADTPICRAKLTQL